MTLKLPRAKDPDQARHNQILEAEDVRNRKLGSDVELGSERFIFRSPNGTRYQLTVTDAGAVTVGPAMASGNITPGATIVLGTVTGSVANAGEVGEVLTATVAAASAISISNGVPFTLASLTLTPGNWEVSSYLHFVTAATTNVTQMQSGVNTVAATLNPTGIFAHNAMTFAPFVPGAGRILSSRTTGNVQTLAAPLTLYCVGQLDFTVSTATAWGGIRAWRRR